MLNMQARQVCAGAQERALRGKRTCIWRAARAGS